MAISDKEKYFDYVMETYNSLSSPGSNGCSALDLRPCPERWLDYMLEQSKAIDIPMEHVATLEGHVWLSIGKTREILEIYERSR